MHDAIARLDSLAQKHGCSREDIVRLNPHKEATHVMGVGAVFTSLLPNEPVFVPLARVLRTPELPPEEYSKMHAFAVSQRAGTTTCKCQWSQVCSTSTDSDGNTHTDCVWVFKGCTC
jgi:hypothetical protein